MSDVFETFMCTVRKAVVYSETVPTTISRIIRHSDLSSSGVLMMDLDSLGPFISVCCPSSTSDGHCAIWRSEINNETIKSQVSNWHDKTVTSYSNILIYPSRSNSWFTWVIEGVYHQLLLSSDIINASTDILPLMQQMADAVGLIFDEMQESVFRSNYLGFATLFSQALQNKENIHYSQAEEYGVLQLHLLYDLKTYKTSGILEVYKRLIRFLTPHSDITHCDPADDWSCSIQFLLDSISSRQTWHTCFRNDETLGWKLWGKSNTFSI